ncbi:MAG: hypothetical protein ACK559_23895, partial [bacterium]
MTLPASLRHSLQTAAIAAPAKIGNAHANRVPESVDATRPRHAQRHPLVPRRHPRPARSDDPLRSHPENRLRHRTGH